MVEDPEPETNMWRRREPSAPSSSGFAPLSALIASTDNCLKEIDFSNVHFGDGAESVVNAVLSCAARGKLQRYNTIPLRPPREVQTLDFADKPLMSHGIHILAATTLVNGNITSLNLANTGMDSGRLNVLLAAMLQRQLCAVPRRSSLVTCQQPCKSRRNGSA